MHLRLQRRRFAVAPAKRLESIEGRIDLLLLPSSLLAYLIMI